MTGVYQVSSIKDAFLWKRKKERKKSWWQGLRACHNHYSWTCTNAWVSWLASSYVVTLDEEKGPLYKLNCMFRFSCCDQGLVINWLWLCSLPLETLSCQVTLSCFKSMHDCWWSRTITLLFYFWISDRSIDPLIHLDRLTLWHLLVSCWAPCRRFVQKIVILFLKGRSKWWIWGDWSQGQCYFKISFYFLGILDVYKLLLASFLWWMTLMYLGRSLAASLCTSDSIWELWWRKSENEAKFFQCTLCVPWGISVYLLM